MTIQGEVQRALRRAARPARARASARYFKTGKGQYAEGDRFLGVTSGDIRVVAGMYAHSTPLVRMTALLHSPWHEIRQCAVLMMVRKYEKGDDVARAQVYRAYLRNTRYINNWDLVDLSAPRIVGAWLDGKSKRVLTRLARSRSVWERRIAVLATFYDIQHGRPKEALRIAIMLIKDEHDLIHKAVGWMLREVGKRCSMEELELFLRKYRRRMPRTTLRYAIERFPEAKRKAYLANSSV